MKKRYIVLIVLLCLLLGLGAFFGPKVYRAVRAYRLAEEFLTRPEQSLDVTVMTQGNRDLDFRLDWQQVQQRRIFTLESGGEKVYYCDGVLYLKNGKGYRFAEAIPDLTPVLEKPWLLVPVTEIRKEDSKWLLSVKTEDFLPQLTGLSVAAQEQGGAICAVQIHTPGQNPGDLVDLKAVTRGDRTVEQVPQSVLDAIGAGKVQADKDLTRDILRLGKGWVLLSSTDPLGVKLDIQVDLLELPLHTQLELHSTGAYSKPIHYLNKDGTGVYFTDGAACTPEGVRIGAPEIPVDTAQLLGMVYYLCFNGDLSCQGDTYRLELDQEGMEQVLFAVAPEAKDMALTLREGTLELTMAGDAISSVEIAMSGQVDLVITQVDIAARVHMEIRQDAFVMDVPQKVLDSLLE